MEHSADSATGGTKELGSTTANSNWANGLLVGLRTPLLCSADGPVPCGLREATDYGALFELPGSMSAKGCFCIWTPRPALLRTHRGLF